MKQLALIAANNPTPALIEIILVVAETEYVSIVDKKVTCKCALETTRFMSDKPGLLNLILDLRAYADAMEDPPAAPVTTSASESDPESPPLPGLEKP